MSSTSAPFGLRPAFHPSGLDRAQALANGIPSAFATAILKGQPVRYQTTAIGGTLGTITPATTSGAWVGAFAGVEWTDTTGRRRVSNNWPANTAYIAGSCIAYFYNDQNLVYEIQATGSVTNANIGRDFNFSASVGYSPKYGTTIGVSGGAGFSTCALNPTPVATGAQGQVKLVGLGREVAYPTGELNAWGDANTIVQVQIANSQIVAPSISV
jgi:hypothetical protein